VGEGLLHPSSNQSMSVRLGIPYLPSEYPTPSLAARGYLCNCAEFYDNPCRAEFRRVRLTDQLFVCRPNRPELHGSI